jgi:hypothetical protein
LREVEAPISSRQSAHRWRSGKGKAIPVRGRGGPHDCETSRLAHLLENRLTDGGEVVSLTRRPPFTPRKIPGTHFSSRLNPPQGHSADGKIISTEKSNDLIGNRIRVIPACSIVPQPTTLLRAPHIQWTDTTNREGITNKSSYSVKFMHDNRKNRNVRMSTEYEGGDII